MTAREPILAGVTTLDDTSTAPRRSSAWLITLAATAVSTYALDAVATAAGVLLVASQLLSGIDHTLALAFLASTYVLWGFGLRANLRANWLLLRRTGTSTNVLSKAAFELTRRRGARTQRIAAGAGYVATELAKEAPYYAGAFGAAVLTDAVSSNEALLFLAGANLGAAAYEYGLALATRTALRRPRIASFDTDWVPRAYLADYYRVVEPDERETIAFFVEAMKDAEAYEPVLFFGTGPTLHHVFLAAPMASEIHLADYLPANLEEIERWLIRDPAAHDWSAFVRYTLECEGVDSPTDEDVALPRGAHPLQDHPAAPGRRARRGPAGPDLPDGDQRLLRRLGDRRSRHVGDVHGQHHRPRRARRAVRHVGPAPLPVLPRRRQAVPERERRRARPAAGPRAALQPAGRGPPPARPRGAGVLRHRPRGRAMLARLIGADMLVPCADGRARRYVNLDYAASTPAMAAVWDAVEAFMPWYSSVHRGSGVKSQVSTAAYEDARDAVAGFAGARAGDAVVFVRNTTEAVNVLAAALPAGTRVLSSAVEHHSAMLPWRRHDVRLLPFAGSPDELLGACARALRAERIDLVAVTGASNVTGEVWPVAELAALAHEHGARLFVDAAQLAPHRPIDMAGAGIDFLAFSGHKLYAPFGAGALVGDARALRAREPLLHGGGAIELVTEDDVIWAEAPERHEAGSPNVVGAVALAAACRALLDLGMEAVAAHERALSERLWRGLAAVPGVRRLALWPEDADRVGVATFTLDGYRHPLLAAVLSAEHAIGVRHGCFCAHPLMARLLGVADGELDRLAAELRAGRHPALPGAVRASVGLGTTPDDIDRLVDALRAIAATGPRSSYLYVAGLDEYRPAGEIRRARSRRRRRRRALTQGKTAGRVIVSA